MFNPFEQGITGELTQAGNLPVLKSHTSSNAAIFSMAYVESHLTQWSVWMLDRPSGDLGNTKRALLPILPT